MSKKLRELQSKKSAAAQEKTSLLQAASTLLDKAATDNRDLSEAEAAEFARLKGASDAKSAEIERLQAMIDLEQEISAASAVAGSVVILSGNGSDIVVEDNAAKDPKLGFRNFGDYASAVFKAALPGNAPDPRLLPLRSAAAPTSFGNEGAGADGGFLVPPEFSKDIFMLSLDDEALLPLTDNVTVTGNSMAFPKDETTPWGTDGITVSWQAEAAREAGVPIVAGDTKVVEQGKADGIFIATTGIGRVPDGMLISGDRARPGDRIIVSGTIGDHGIAILSKRENLTFETAILSDTAALHGLVAAMAARVPDIHCLRDPTRGGLATTLNELASQSGVGMRIRESAIPIRAEVAAACELLGIDPLYVANEGKLVAICADADTDALLCAMREHPLGQNAAIIGEVHEDEHSFVQMETALGGVRLVDWLAGEILPRIC